MWVRTHSGPLMFLSSESLSCFSCLSFVRLAEVPICFFCIANYRFWLPNSLASLSWLFVRTPSKDYFHGYRRNPFICILAHPLLNLPFVGNNSFFYFLWASWMFLFPCFLTLALPLLQAPGLCHLVRINLLSMFGIRNFPNRNLWLWA